MTRDDAKAAYNAARARGDTRAQAAALAKLRQATHAQLRAEVGKRIHKHQSGPWIASVLQAVGLRRG